MLFGPHGEVLGGQRGLVREGGQVLVGLGDVGPGDRGAVGGDGRGRGGVLEVGEGGLFAYVGLLGGGAQGVALLAVGGVLGDDRLRQSGDRVDDRGRLVGAGHGERGEQEPARGGGLLDGPVEVGEGVRSEPARGGVLSASCSAVLCSSLIAPEYALCASRALPLPVSAARRTAAMPHEIASQGGRGVGAELFELPVDAGAAALGEPLSLGPPGGDEGGDLVALVGQGVGERDGLLGPCREVDELLRVTDLPGRGHEGGCGRAGDRRGDDRYGDDEPVAHPRGASSSGVGGGARRGVRGGSCGNRRAPLVRFGGRLLALASRPHLPHRCSHS